MLGEKSEHALFQTHNRHVCEFDLVGGLVDRHFENGLLEAIPRPLERGFFGKVNRTGCWGCGRGAEEGGRKREEVELRSEVEVQTDFTIF